MKIFMALPILIPFATAGLGLLLRKNQRVQRGVSLGGSVLLLGASVTLLIEVVTHGIQVLQLGSWPAPYGITFAADILSSIMVMITSVMGLASVFYSLAAIDSERESFGYFPVMQMLVFGVNGAFLTGDIFNLYVWFEVLLISSFALLTLGRSRAQIAGAIPYVVLNLVGSTLFLAAVGLLYGNTGTLNFAHLSVKLSDPGLREIAQSISMLLLVAFGLKAAVFPLFFWLPPSYPTPPVAISALFAGLLTKVGVYALIRVHTLIFPHPLGEANYLLLVISGITMLTGVLGAVAQNEFRRILSFHIVSQIGYMTLGLAFNTRLGIAASILYIVHHIIVKANLFFVSGVVQRIGGSFSLQKLGGLYRHHPQLSVLFLIPALSLAGVPPLSGFWGKFFLAHAGMEAGHYTLVAVLLVVGLLTTYSMTKIWNEAFWKPIPQGEKLASLRTSEKWHLLTPIFAFSGITLAIGFFTEPFAELALRAADELIDRNNYIQAVLGTGPGDPR